MQPNLSAAALRAAPRAAAACPPSAIFSAAERLLPAIEVGQYLDAAQIRAAMTLAFRRSDAEGYWDWKSAYDACEAVQILVLRRYGAAFAQRNCAPQKLLADYERIAARFPAQTRRSETGQALQQFSTPLPLAYVAAAAATRAARPSVWPAATSVALQVKSEPRRWTFGLAPTTGSTVTDDFDRQVQVFEFLTESRSLAPQLIRQKLTENVVRAADKRAQL